MNKPARTISEVALTAVFGVAAFIAPALLDPPKTLPKAPLFPIVREAVEHLRPASFIAIAFVGLAAGLLGRTQWAFLGLATVAMLPVCMAAELFTDPKSHNLFPIELVMYAAFSIPALLTAGLGRALRTLALTKRNTT